jgi:hypothetical protein
VSATPAVIGACRCAAMVIADGATGTVATSQPPPAGDRPRVIGLVNAPVQWGAPSSASISRLPS